MSDQERDGLFAVFVEVHSTLHQLKDLGWKPPLQVEDFGKGVEIMRALATDTRSLVRGPIAPRLASVMHTEFGE